MAPSRVFRSDRLISENKAITKRQDGTRMRHVQNPIPPQQKAEVCRFGAPPWLLRSARPNAFVPWLGSEFRAISANMVRVTATGELLVRSPAITSPTVMTRQTGFAFLPSRHQHFPDLSRSQRRGVNTADLPAGRRTEIWQFCHQAPCHQSSSSISYSGGALPRDSTTAAPDNLPSSGSIFSNCTLNRQSAPKSYRNSID